MVEAQCLLERERLHAIAKLGLDGRVQPHRSLHDLAVGVVDGATFDIAISRDPGQKFLYVADGANHKVHVLDRESLEVLTTFGDGGRQPGQFYAVHSVATDSHGNLYTTETYNGQRVQKFTYKGLAPVTKKHQGTVWPTD